MCHLHSILYNLSQMVPEDYFVRAVPDLHQRHHLGIEHVGDDQPEVRREILCKRF